MDLACAHKSRPVAPGHLLKSLTPLYLARVASFVIETRDMVSSEVEDRIEELCLCFERQKPYLTTRWSGEPATGVVEQPPEPAPAETTNVEVRP
jgi:hypothetical protein